MRRVRSGSERALVSVKVPGRVKRKLPVTWPECETAERSYQRYHRNARMYLQWLGSSDREAEIGILAEKWELQPGRVRSIIERIDESPGDSLPAEVRNRGIVINAQQIDKLLDDVNAQRAELLRQIGVIEESRARGGEFVLMEVVEESGGRSFTRKKKVPLDGHLRQLYVELQKHHMDTGVNVAGYGGRQDRLREFKGKMEFGPTREFVEMLDRLDKLHGYGGGDGDSEDLEEVE